MLFNSGFDLSEYFNKHKHLFKEIRAGAKTILLREGETAKKIFLIQKGCLRMWINHEGKEITFQFFFEGETVASIESLRTGKPGIVNIETLEDSILFVLNKKNFEMLLNQTPELKGFMMETAFKRFAHYSRLYLSFLKNNPAERYKELLQNEPRIIQRVPQHYIASYLGITPVSLSRIRNKLSRHTW